jgi:hypothetical protein
MKLKLKSEVKEAKTFNYVMHTLEFTEADILGYELIKHLFINSNWDTCAWDELMQNVESASIPHIKNIKKDSFIIEIDDHYNFLDLLEQFLTDNNLQYEIQ